MKSWKRHIFDLSGSSIASAIATAVDGLIFMILLNTWVHWGDVTVGVAAALGAVFGGVVHYTMCRFWVFERFSASLKQSAFTYFAMSWLAAAIHGAMTAYLVDLMGHSAGWFSSKGIVWIFWTYPMSRYVVFGGLGAQGDPQAATDSD